MLPHSCAPQYCFLLSPFFKKKVPSKNSITITVERAASQLNLLLITFSIPQYLHPCNSYNHPCCYCLFAKHINKAYKSNQVQFYHLHVLSPLFVCLCI